MDFRGKNIDLVGKAPLWFGISLALMLIGLVSLVAFQGLNLGIDFKGGGELTYRIPASKRPSGNEVEFQEQVRAALGDKTKVAKLQIAGGDTLVVQTDARGGSELSAQERVISASLAKFFGIAPDAKGVVNYRPIAQQQVGPIIGKELRRNAIYGVLVGVFLIAAWIYLRYNFGGEGLRYAVAGIAALVHDVIVLIGLFALIGGIDKRIEVDSAFIAALLTVVGYSINDSVVIFDRIRENLRLRRRDPYLKVVNDSLLETMSRSVNTGMTVLIMLFALLMFGGGAIYNFVLAMLVGIASGLYSSIFNASMVLVAWHNWDEKRKNGGTQPVSASRAAAPKTQPRVSTQSRPATSASSMSTPVSTATPIASGSLATRVLEEGETADTPEDRARRESLKSRAKRRF